MTAPTPTVNVFDVAEQVLRLTGPIPLMKLHQLVYYAQAWSLVWDQRPLFQERILAWINGPVIAELYKPVTRRPRVQTTVRGNPKKLDAKAKETIQAVVDFYNPYSSPELVDLTCSEAPWKIARKGLSPCDRGDSEIQQETLLWYYSELIGEAQSFKMHTEERLQAERFRKEHACPLKDRLLSYTFTPSGARNIIEVTCHCGAKKNVTNYNA